MLRQVLRQAIFPQQLAREIGSRANGPCWFRVHSLAFSFLYIISIVGGSQLDDTPTVPRHGSDENSLPASRDFLATLAPFFPHYVQDMGLKHYRLSIAMPRIFPGGKGPADEDGVAFYNRLIDCLLAAGITPTVTLYHWDLPLELETDHGGWQSEVTRQRFVEYARVCFDRFGDRVKTW